MGKPRFSEEFKVDAIKQITEQRRPFRLTKLGCKIRETDPVLEKYETLWAMHQELTASPEKVETWHFFANEFKSRNPEFTREILEEELSGKLSYHSKMHFGPNSKMIPVIARKLVECYTSDRSLGPLGLIHAISNGIYGFNDQR